MLTLSPLNAGHSAVLYTLGIVISLIGTGFLIGVRADHMHGLVFLTKPHSSFSRSSSRYAISFPPPPWILHVHLPSQMFAPVRVVATIILIASMGLVFVGAFVLGNAVRNLVWPTKENVLELMLFPAAVYKYVPDLFVGLLRILIHPIIVFVIIEYLAYTWSVYPNT
jgi:hypothetical protein